MARKAKGDNVKVIPLHTLIEMICGRLTVAYNSDPAFANRIAMWMIYCIKIEQEGNILKMRKKYTIEVKFTPDDDNLHKVMFKLMRKAARTVGAQANLIADNNNRPPEISFQTEDFFESGTTQSLANADDDDDDEEGEDEAQEG